MRILLLPALLVAGTAAAQPYRPSTLLHPGWSAKETAPGEWHITGTAHRMGEGIAVALYRAAELATATGADELRVIQQRVQTGTLRDRRTGYVQAFHETATVTVRVVRSDADRTACAMPEPRQCLTLPVAGLLARYGAELGQPVARPGELPAAPVMLTAHPRAGSPSWAAPGATRVSGTPTLAGILFGAGSPARYAPAPAVEATRAPLPPSLPPRSATRPQLSPAEIEDAQLRAATPM